MEKTDRPGAGGHIKRIRKRSLFYHSDVIDPYVHITCMAGSWTHLRGNTFMKIMSLLSDIKQISLFFYFLSVCVFTCECGYPQQSAEGMGSPGT